MKKQLILIFVICLTLGFVAAQNYDAFRLSGPTNAHAEKSTGTNYVGNIIELDKEITGDTNPVLWLSDDTNAHITSESGIYPIPIYFGQRYKNCVLQSGLTCPPGNYERIVELSSSLNAHGAGPGLSNSDYYKIFCCEFDFCGDGVCSEGCDVCVADCGTCPAGCGDGTCDAGECGDGCTADCDVDDCCGIEGCNSAVGEDCDNCADCACTSPQVCSSGECVISGCSGPEDCTEHNKGEPFGDGEIFCSGTPGDMYQQQYDDPECNSGSCVYPHSDYLIYDCEGAGCLDGVCLDECTDNDHMECFDDKIYWYDSCGNQQGEAIEDCDDNQDTCTWGSWNCPTGSIWTRSQTGIDYYCDEISVSCKSKNCVGSQTVNCGTDNQICGESATECITAIYWADMNGVLITEAQIGDSVLMVYEQEGVYVPLTFDIYENDLDGGTGLADDEIRIGVESFELNGNTVAKWKITPEDLTKTSDYQEFEFRVDSKISSYLEIIITEANSRPSINIIKPVDDSKYTINYNSGDETEYIEFEQFSSDADDDLKVQWNFGDGSESDWLLNCLTGGNCDTEHKYDSSGTKTIFATAEEIGRTNPQSAIDYSNIYIYKKGINVFSKIASPIVEGRVVQMDGSDSFVCECYDDVDDCEIQANGKTCNHIDDNIDPLWCYDFIVIQDYDFIFQWIFDKGTNDEETKIGRWSTDYYDVVEFTHFFPDLGVHTVELDVGYISN